MLASLLFSLLILPTWSSPRTCPQALQFVSEESQTAAPSGEDITAAYEFLMRSVGFSVLTAEELAALVVDSDNRIFQVPEKGGVQFGQFKEALNKVEEILLARPIEVQKEFCRSAREFNLRLQDQRQNAAQERRQIIQSKVQTHLGPVVLTPTLGFNYIDFSTSGITASNGGAVKFWNFPTNTHSSSPRWSTLRRSPKF